VSTTLVSLWTDLRRRLEAAGVDSPVLDARLLVEAGAGVSRLDIVTDPRRELSDAQAAAVEALAARRIAREPIAHIIGRKHFWKQEWIVSPAVLIPRPDTEALVEAALKILPFAEPRRVLDLGVGSGAILLAVLAERPLASGVGIDLSSEALEVARINAENLGLTPRIELRVGDWHEGVDERFDLVLSNPPYIPSDDIDALAPEVARFEPRLALDGGGDGLEAYRIIVPALSALLKPGGAFGLEVGAGQADAVARLAVAAGLEDVALRTDLGGVERVVLGLRPETTGP
jgi:release factor glutamine methyltransferase